MRLIDADALIDDLMERYCKECDKRRGVKNGEYRIIYEIGEVPCRACEVDDVKAELEEAPTISAEMTKVNCWLDDCKYCEDGVCTAEEIELYDNHVCDGGCDDGWLMEESEEEDDEID